MSDFRLHPDAGSEIDEAAEYYFRKSKSLELAEDFADEVRVCIAAALSHGLRYLQHFPGTQARYRRVSRFPYLVIFYERPDEVEVLIVAVAHERRRPGYWRGRLDDGR